MNLLASLAETEMETGVAIFNLLFNIYDRAEILLKQEEQLQNCSRLLGAFYLPVLSYMLEMSTVSHYQFRDPITR